LLLAGDIGGTKTALAIYAPDDGPRSPLVEATFPSADYESLEALAREFLAKMRLPVDRASFGVAGPVSDGKSKATNLPWTIDETRLREELGLDSARLLNDLEAVAHATPFLGPGDLHPLQAGEADPEGALAVIAPGTGLGEAFLTREGTGFRAHPSEGGHTDFAPANELEMGLLRYLADRFGHASYERVSSGRGFPNVYYYLKESGHAEETPPFAEELAAAKDPTPVIMKAALDPENPDPLSAAALDLFVSVLGARAGNLALTVLATGGVFVGGGIPPRILPVLERGGFVEAFRRKGRFSELMEKVPVNVILNKQVALVGAACYGLETYGEGAIFEQMPPKGDNK
jgi:glucokinase